MEPNNLELYDIITTPYVPWWRQPWFYIFLILALITIFLFGWLLYNYLKQKKLTPYERALQELESISLQKIATQADQKKYYVRLSTLLKKYFQEQFNYDVVGMTDHELLNFLAKQNFPADIAEKVTILLSGLDEVKFAEKKAEQEKIRDDNAATLVILAHSKAFAKKLQENGGLDTSGTL